MRTALSAPHRPREAAALTAQPPANGKDEGARTALRLPRLWFAAAVVACWGTVLLVYPFADNPFRLPKQLFAVTALTVMFAVDAVIRAGIATPRNEAPVRGGGPRLPAWFLAWAALALWSLAAVPLQGVNLYVSLPQTLNLAAYGVYALAIAHNLAGPENAALRARLLQALLLLGAIEGVYGMVQFLGFDPVFEPARGDYAGRLLSAGTIGTPMLFGELLGVLGVVAAGAVVAGTRPRQTWPGLAALAAIGLGLAASLTRSAIASLGFALLVLAAVLRWRAPELWHRAGRRLLVIVAAFPAAIAGVALLSPALRWRFTALASPLEGSGGLKLFYLRFVAYMIAEKPVAGHGLGSFPVQYYEAQAHYLPELNLPLARGYTLVHQAHNDPAQLFAELGGVGLLLGFAALLAFMRRCLAAMRNEDATDRDRLVVAFLAAAVLACVVSSLTGFPFHSAPNALVLATLIGLAEASCPRAHALRWYRRLL